jgi:O-antigen biosynthesis protein WbqP
MLSAKRIVDLLICIPVVSVLIFPMLLIGLIIRLDSTGPALYWSSRIGRERKIFIMPKFRSMSTNAPTVATDLLKDPTTYITRVGRFLRKTSLDEFPQLWSILKGDMTLVGPRPALFNQELLIELRERYGVNKLVPGLTGWAQVNGRDEVSLERKVLLDAEYLQKISISFDFYILWLTVLKVLTKDGVSH